MIQQGQAQIQNVADNAAYYYGATSPAAIAAKQEAAVQVPQVPLDVNAILASLSPVGPTSVPWWLWLAGGGLALYLVTR